MEVTALAPSPRPVVTLDEWPHPLTAEGRDTRTVVVRPGTTLAALVADALPGVAADTLIVALDGRFVPRDEWGRVRPIDGQLVTVRAALAGDGDSDPLRIILQIAVLIASIYVPQLAAFAGWSDFARAALGAAISIGGNLIINALVPPRLPSAPEAPEPVYALIGGANRARPYEPLLLVLGEHRVFPDLGAHEYTEFAGGDQYLHQIFHWGLGELDVTELRIGDSLLDEFEEVETEWAGADGRIALVAGNVDTEAGAALDDTDWIERSTGPNTRRIGIDLVGMLFARSKKGASQSHSVPIEVEYWAQGDESNKTAWTFTAQHAETTPYRKTLSYTLSSVGGTYVVRVRRTTEPSDSDRIYDDISWAALRSYQPDTGVYTGQTRLGLKIRATGQLAGRLDRLSGIARHKIPVWDGSVWSTPQPSSNPAWLYRWYARGIRIGGRLVAGVGLADTRIDDEGIQDWGAWCDDEGLTCNLVLDRAQSHAEVLTLIAQCGRASPSWGSGRLGVVWDAADTPVTAMFTPGNIVAGSFEITYAAGRAAEEVVVRYVDPDLDWQWNTVRRTVPGVTHPDHTATLTLDGVTDRNQAAVECNLQAARQVYHRRRIRWEAGREGFAVARGDVARLTHGLIDGGRAGRLLDATTERLTLHRPVTLTGGEDWLLLRLPEGALHRSRVRHPNGAGTAGETDTVVLDAPLPDAPDAHGASPLDTLWRYYAGDAEPARVRIVALEPAGDDRVHIEAIDEVQAYYDAATSDLDVPLPLPRLRPVRVVHMLITETLIRAGAGYAVELNAALTVSGPWRGGVIRAGAVGGTPRTVARLIDGETTASWLSAPSGTLIVTAVPGTEVAPAGARFSMTYTVLGKLAPPGGPSDFLLDALADGTRRFWWAPPEDVDLAGHRIRHAEAVVGTDPPAWDDMTPLHHGLLTSSPYETNDPGAGRWRFALRAEDTSGLLSETAAIIAELPDPRLGVALLWAYPSASGWPGTSENAVRSDDGMDAMEGEGDYTWDDLTTWNAWVSWGLGDGDDGATTMRYTTDPIDLGAEASFAIAWDGDSTGTVAYQYRTATSAAGLDDATWQDYVSTSLLSVRHIQLRWELTGDGTELLRLDHFRYSLLGPGSEEKFLDADTSDWTGSAAAGRTIPATLSVVTDVDVTLQNVGAGWSWTLVNKTDPKIKIFDGDGDAADATVDVIVRGVR